MKTQADVIHEFLEGAQTSHGRSMFVEGDVLYSTHAPKHILARRGDFGEGFRVLVNSSGGRAIHRQLDGIKESLEHRRWKAKTFFLRFDAISEIIPGFAGDLRLAERFTFKRTMRHGPGTTPFTVDVRYRLCFVGDAACLVGEEGQSYLYPSADWFASPLALSPVEVVELHLQGAEWPNQRAHFNRRDEALKIGVPESLLDAVAPVHNFALYRPDVGWTLHATEQEAKDTLDAALNATWSKGEGCRIYDLDKKKEYVINVKVWMLAY